MSDAWPPRIREILEDNPDAYGGLVPPHGGMPARAQAQLGGLSADQLFDRTVASRLDADAALAGLWLWLDALDECHRIVQSGQSGTAGTGSLASDSRPHKWGWCQHRSCPVASPENR